MVVNNQVVATPGPEPPPDNAVASYSIPAAAPAPSSSANSSARGGSTPTNSSSSAGSVTLEALLFAGDTNYTAPGGSAPLELLGGNVKVNLVVRGW